MFLINNLFSKAFMLISTKSVQYRQTDASRFSLPALPTRDWFLRAFVVFCLMSLATANATRAQTKYTADFSTSPSFDYEGGQTYYKTRTTVSINGVNYLIHNAINADFTWTGSAVSYNPYSGVGLLIEREDQQVFNFYGIDLNYTSVNTDLAHAPWLTVTYQGENSTAAPTDSYNETSKNFSVSKPSGVAVKYVQLYFADLATLVLDNLIVGPATTTPTCTNPSIPTIAATRTAICAGSNTTLSIQSGSLNDATNWKWYSGSCGGTLVGTGSSIQVSPGSTTTYFVRGEGGCVTPGACASQQITVSAPYSVNLTNNGPLTCAKNSVTLTTTGGPAGASYTYSSGAQTSSASSATASVSLAGPYSVTVSVPGGCSATATTVVSSNTVAPSVSITPSATAICAGQSITLMAAGATTYRWSTSQTTMGIMVTPTMTSTYSVTGTNMANGCTATATASVTVIALPNASFSGLSASVCVDASPIMLTPTTSGGSFSGPGITGSQFNPGSAGTGGPYTINYTVTSKGCTNSTSQSVTVKPQPIAPILVTQANHPYPGSVSSLTISQNTGDVMLMVSGCSDGTISWPGGSAASLAVPTNATGTFTYQAYCTVRDCISPAATATITVVPTTLGVLYRDADYGNLTNNIIKPFLELTNAGGPAIPYGEVTVRYWFTSEGNAPPTNLALYYAQLGAVSMNYVALSQPRQGAYGYIEYSFPGGGSLDGNGNSGPIENGIQKTDGSNFNESDDYSYQANYQDYVPNMHITAYRNGVIFYGQEPTLVASQTALQVYSAAKDGGITSQIQTRLEVRNTGNVGLPVGNLKLRYYFTSDNNQLASVYVDYADIDAANVQARVVQLSAPVSGADSYVELSFPGNSMQLGALSSLGVIDFRLVRSDYGLFDQSNDYSYAGNYGYVGLNTHVASYLNNTLIFGTPPAGAAARVMAVEAGSGLQTRLLGNPVVDNQALVEITGVAGQALRLTLVDLQGRTVHEQLLEPAGQTEQVRMPLGSTRGLLLLEVSTATQHQTLKVLRP